MFSRDFLTLGMNSIFSAAQSPITPVASRDISVLVNRPVLSLRSRRRSPHPTSVLALIVRVSIPLVACGQLIIIPVSGTGQFYGSCRMISGLSIIVAAFSYFRSALHLVVLGLFLGHSMPGLLSILSQEPSSPVEGWSWNSDTSAVDLRRSLRKRSLSLSEGACSSGSGEERGRTPALRSSDHSS